MNYNKITELAADKRISIPQIADKIGMSKRGLYAGLKENSLRVDTLEKIAGVFEVPVSIFFTAEDEIVPETAQKELDNASKEISELKSRYQNQLTIISLNEKLIESMNKRLQSLEKTVSAIDTKLFSLLDTAKPYVKALIKSEHPEFIAQKDPSLFLKYMDDDPLTNKIHLIIEMITPYGRGKVKELKLK